MQSHVAKGRGAALLFLLPEPILSGWLHHRDAVMEVNQSERLHLCKTLQAEQSDEVLPSSTCTNILLLKKPHGI